MSIEGSSTFFTRHSVFIRAPMNFLFTRHHVVVYGTQLYSNTKCALYTRAKRYKIVVILRYIYPYIIIYAYVYILL